MHINGLNPVPPTTPTSGVRSATAAANPAFQNVMTQVSAQPVDGKIARSAKQFEALMIGQILKSAQSGDEGLFGSSDQGGNMAIEMAQEQFAQAMAARGGLGVAKIVEKGLRHSAK